MKKYRAYLEIFIGVSSDLNEETAMKMLKRRGTPLDRDHWSPLNYSARSNTADITEIERWVHEVDAELETLGKIEYYYDGAGWGLKVLDSPLDNEVYLFNPQKNHYYPVHDIINSPIINPDELEIVTDWG